MARVGAFSGPAFSYGQPLSVVHPIDNDFQAARFFPDLLREPGVTPQEREELQREYEELLAALMLGRDWYGSA